MVKLVIFDCDGVLVDSEYISIPLLAEDITAAGYPMDTEEALRRYKGGKFSHLQPQIEAEFGVSLGNDWIKQYYRRQFSALEKDVTPVPGIASVLDFVDSSKLEKAVASQGPIEKMDITLSATGLLNRFNGRIFSANMVKRPKPAPDLFLHVAETCGHHARDCLVIENSPTGVRGARAAGMAVMGFAAGGDGKELSAAGANVIFQSMSEFAEIFETWAAINVNSDHHDA